MKKNLILCLLLALAMMVSLTACQVEIPGIGTVNINDGSTGGNAGGDHTIHTGSDNDESLALLRKSMAEVPDYIFAAAYIGSAAGGPDDFELPIQEWVSKAAPELCAQYPFVRNIPRERVVGSGGSLFCIVPRDPNATLAVNRIRYNTESGEYENLEVLYRSETGEPILVYACADMGESPFPDTEITVTDSSGRTAVWRPRYGTSIRPDDYDTDAPMGYDFTNYSQEHGEDYADDYGGDVDGDVSWIAPTAEQLCRNVWVWDGDLDRQYAIASIFFEPGGWVTFEWWYEEDNGVYQEVYEGDWSLQDDMLGLRMTRTGASGKVSGPLRSPACSRCRSPWASRTSLF